MADSPESRPGALPDHECREWSQECDGEVQWQTDGTKRCVRHQRIRERDGRRQRLVAWTVAALVVVAVGVITNALIGPEEGPSQARAWEVCHEYAAGTLDLPTDAQFAELPTNPSERVKLIVASDLYRVLSYYELPDAVHRDFQCTVRYLGHNKWEMADFAVAP